MDEAIANVRSSQGHETFDDAYLTELCVKRKYMGHRNARFDLFLTLHVISHQIVNENNTRSQVYAVKSV